MRVKIKGPITVERLAEALQAAQANFEEGCQFYGANLYLTCFDADGLPTDLVDHRGTPLMITINASSGELVRPALTARGEERRQKIKDEAEGKEAKERAAWEEKNRKAQLEHQERMRQRQEAEDRYKGLNKLTATLLERIPDRFIGGLNSIVQAVWEDLSPIETQGKSKGQPKPMPWFEIQEGGLRVCSNGLKSPKKVANPIGALKFPYRELEPYWKYPAWVSAVERFPALMGKLASEEKEKAEES